LDFLKDNTSAFSLFGWHNRCSSGSSETTMPVDKEKERLSLKTIRIITRHPLGLILELIGLVSVAIIVCKPVALAQVGGGMATTWGGAPHDKPLPADYDGDGIAVYRPPFS
jgi:hypothetical protein